MAGKTYSELLKDPRWQRKRLEILERDKWRCVACEDDKNTLHVHHKQYRYGAKPWDYDNDYLETLCEQCHERATEQGKLMKILLASLTVNDMDVLLGFGMAMIMRGHQTLLDTKGNPLTILGAAAFINPRKSVVDAISSGETDMEKLWKLAQSDSPGCYPVLGAKDKQ